MKKMLPNKSYLFFLIMAVIIILLWSMGEYATDNLVYHRSAITEGQYWRVITGHLIHSNAVHLLLNLASLLLVGWLFCHHLNYKIWLAIFTISALMISMSYFWIAPEFEYYVGLSATLYAVIIVGALLDIKQQPLIAILILLLVTGRVLWQQFYGSVDELAALIDERVAVESHLFGITAGYFQGIILLLYEKLSGTQLKCE